MSKTKKSTLRVAVTTVLCQTHVEEIALHLFFGCMFRKAKLVNLKKAKLADHWHTMELCTTLFDMIATRKSLFQRKLFMEMFIIAAWGICR
jgi:hypothetical protein